MSDLPRVALVVDRPDWAFANHAAALAKHLSHEFRFQVIPMHAVRPLWRVPMATRGSDLVFHFWRGALRTMRSREFLAEVHRELGDVEEYQRRYLSMPTATQICDHLCLSESDIEEFAPVLASDVVSYSTTSQRLNRQYSRITAYPAPWGVAPDGVDLDLFTPAPAATAQGPVRVGWAGNSLWNAGVVDVKGLATVLRPAMQMLRSEGVDVVARYQDRAVAMRAHREMPDYYRQLDIFVCASSTEGSPNTVLEAMACGVPVVSTDVGVVPEVFGPLQRRFLLRERSVKAMKDAIGVLAADPDLRAAIRDENLERVRDRDWAVVAGTWLRFFKDCLNA